MTERSFRILLGGLLLAGLFFDLAAVVWAVIGLLLFQGVTNWRIPRVVSRLRYGSSVVLPRCCGHAPTAPAGRINFESERALCLIVGAFLVVTYGLFNAELWFLTWLIGFALFAAGLSGVCPMVLGLRYLGFR
ncbi:MAG TPA: hypothetical protein VGA00_11185 [Acidiferrobacterales bacterium]